MLFCLDDKTPCLQSCVSLWSCLAKKERLLTSLDSSKTTFFFAPSSSSQYKRKTSLLRLQYNHQPDPDPWQVSLRGKKDLETLLTQLLPTPPHFPDSFFFLADQSGGGENFLASSRTTSSTRSRDCEEFHDLQWQARSQEEDSFPFLSPQSPLQSRLLRKVQERRGACSCRRCCCRACFGSLDAFFACSAASLLQIN